ncbi:unnamed protein product [Rhodiola kirilowii]
MNQAAAAPPRPGEGYVRVLREGASTSTVEGQIERLEDGEIAGDGGSERGSLRGKLGPARKDFGEKSKAFWQIKSAANRAAETGMELKFHQNLLAANEISVSEEVWRRTASDWMFTLVEWVFGARPILGKLKGFIRAKWGDESIVSVAELKPGIFIFKFAREEDSNKILSLGPWSFDSRPLVHKPWSLDDNYELESVTALPIWVRFPGLNLHMRSEEILSMIASTVGKPIRTDGFTATSEKLSYARVLIEVYASNELKKEVCIKGPRGTNYYQKIHYEWVPPRCSHCHRFGHIEKQCIFPRLSIEEEDDEDFRIGVDPEIEQGSEEQVMESAALKIRQSLKVAGEGSREDQNLGSKSLSHSQIPDTPQEEGRADEVENKELTSKAEGDSSSNMGISVSIEESNDSIESEEPFIEVKRKIKKSGKKKEKKRGMRIEPVIPPVLNEVNNRRSKVKGALHPQV